ncbi:MAG: AAA family ATPase [Candidatus Bathyarchaeota archaeon]|nr:AAA family ATPase [Candidatus Bathyarchaeota archaeon]
MTKIVVGLAGMPGVGKAVFRKIAERKGFTVVVMGNEIREETKRRGLKPSPKNIGKTMLQLRKEEGPAVVAKRCILKIDEAKGNTVVVDGIRSLHETEEYRRHYQNFILIAIHSSPKVRFQRLFRRKRSDDPKNWKTFVRRDQRELSVGLGDAIAMADYLIVNEGTREEFKVKIHEVLEAALKRWTS